VPKLLIPCFTPVQHLKELEDRVNSLLQTTEEQASENTHLRELVERLQRENENLKGTAGGGGASGSSSSSSSSLPPFSAAAIAPSSSSPAFSSFADFASTTSAPPPTSGGDTTTTSTTGGGGFPYSAISSPGLLSPSAFLQESSDAVTTPRGGHVNPLFDPSTLFSDYRDTSYDQALDDVFNTSAAASGTVVVPSTTSSSADDYNRDRLATNAAFGGAAVAPAGSAGSKTSPLFEVDEDALCSELKDKAVCHEVRAAFRFFETGVRCYSL
jgi:hypothetical protein